MAMILDAFVDSFVDKLTSLFSEKAGMVIGVKDELQRLQRRMERIQKFLEAAERRRLEDPDTNHWVSELKDVAYDADDIVDRCRLEGALLPVDQPSSYKKIWVCFNISYLSSCITSVPHRYQIAENIKSLNDRIEEIYEDRLRFKLEEGGEKQMSQKITVVNARQTSSLVQFDVVGCEIEETTKELVNLIVEERMNRCRVFAVTGMGGIGKTTLAQKIYNDKKIKTEFQIKVFICVSQYYNEIALLKQVIRGAGYSYHEDSSKSELESQLQSVVIGKSIFLVLDGVWRSDVWICLFRNPLQSSAAIVRILVTTRDENIANEMRAVHIHRVNLLSDQASWEMLRRWVFVEGMVNEIGNLKGLGIQIVKKCSGLPLAIKAIAGVLANKGTNRKEWQKVLTNHAWSMSNLHEEVPAALYLSYDDLPSPLKQCFVYCSLFPEDASLDCDHLVQLWVAEGFVKKQSDSSMEDVAEGYYNDLIRRNLLLPNLNFSTLRACKMHDLFRSLAMFLSRDEIFSGNDMASKTTSRTKLRRLSIENKGSLSGITDLMVEQKCLRTLLVVNCINELNVNQMVGLARLRVLKINDINLERIPDSIGDLIHLRYLNLDFTMIKELPESIGRLINLEILHLYGCSELTTLPKSITKLQNLRCLNMNQTSLTFIPEGISKLEMINDLNGFVVADPRQQKGAYSSVEELKSLYQLRKLVIFNFGRTQKAVSLQKLTRLVELKLFFSEAVERPLQTEENLARIKEVVEELCPPQCLEHLELIDFFGNRYPSWAQSPSFGEHLPYLTTLKLIYNISCPQLPPVGELPQLSNLIITAAHSVMKIGPEFLGIGVGDGAHTTTRTAFPNLQILSLCNMPNLEEWTFGQEVDGIEEAQALPKLLLLPRLDELKLIDCPKLEALPKGLEQSNVKKLYIERADMLRSVDNLSNVKEELTMVYNRRLERVSHLPALKVLVVQNCPALNCVEKLVSLQRLELFDTSMVGLPEWLPRLLMERNSADDDDDDDDFFFQFTCSSKALSRLLKGGPDWPIIERIPRVFASEFEVMGRSFLRYTRNPFNYDTNVET